jgi:hypothetical protein
MEGATALFRAVVLLAAAVSEASGRAVYLDEVPLGTQSKAPVPNEGQNLNQWTNR